HIVAHPVIAGRRLEAGAAQGDEALMAEAERGLAVRAHRQRIFRIGAHAPARAVGALAPALAAAQAEAHRPAAHLGDSVEPHVPAEAVLHHSAGAAIILRIVRIARPDGDHVVDLVAEQHVVLDLVEALLGVAEPYGHFLGEAPVVAQLHARAALEPELLVL